MDEEDEEEDDDDEEEDEAIARGGPPGSRCAQDGIQTGRGIPAHFFSLAG